MIAGVKSIGTAKLTREMKVGQALAAQLVELTAVCLLLSAREASGYRRCGSSVNFEPRNPVATCQDGKLGDAFVRCSLQCALRPLCRGIRIFSNGGGGGCAILSSELEVSAAAQSATATNCSGDRIFAWKLQQLNLSSCSQSTLYDGVCTNAIDGNLEQSHSLGFACCHTNAAPGTSQWWQAATVGRAFIGLVRIYNRQDCCASRLTNFAISVDGQQCASYNSSVAFSVQDFTCERVGVSVMITLRHLGEYLSLCEVIAFGRLL